MTSYEKNAKTIIAKTINGQEYIYCVNDTYQVSKQNADFICKVLNDTLYKLNVFKGEKWKVYKVSDYTYKRAFYKLRKCNGYIKVYENWTIYNN